MFEKTNNTPKAIAIAIAIADWTHNDTVAKTAWINPNDLLNLKPISKAESDGYEVYAYQWGDVTILALYDNGRITVKTRCW